jgi:hypothetical protein
VEEKTWRRTNECRYRHLPADSFVLLLELDSCDDQSARLPLITFDGARTKPRETKETNIA